MIISICNGEIKYLYNETINLNSLGEADIQRASYVEPSDDKWYVDFSPIGEDKIIKGFGTRSEAIKYEIKYIENNIL
jgi:hypothetical protein